MTRKATITQSDLNRLAKAAKENGACIEVEIDGVIYRFRPDNGDQSEKPPRKGIRL